MAGNSGRQEGTGAIVREFVVLNEGGLHARPASAFVRAAMLFASEIEVQYERGDWVSGKSIMGLMTLAARGGTTVRVSADGPDAAAALEMIGRLFEARFDPAVIPENP